MQNTQIVKITVTR